MKLSKDQLKEKIIAGIYENHAGKISGSTLQQILLDMVDSLSSDSAQPVKFGLSDVVISPINVIIGTDIRVSGNLQNIGSAAGSTILKIELQTQPRPGQKPIVVWSKDVPALNLAAGASVSIDQVIPTKDIGISIYRVVLTADAAVKSQWVRVMSNKEYVISGQVTQKVTKTPFTSTLSSASALDINSPSLISDNLRAGLISDRLTAASAPGSSLADNLGGIWSPRAFPVEGVKVYLKENQVLSTVTDSNGNYTLKSTSQLASGTLVFNHSGYFQKEVAINGQTEINVILSPSRFDHLKDDFNNRFDDLVNLKDQFKDVITADTILSNNLHNTKVFIDQLNSQLNIDKDNLENGSFNNTLVDNYKTTFNPIFEETKKIQDEIAKTGSTPELESKLTANVELINAGTSALLSTIGNTNSDLTTGSTAYKYLNTEFKTNLSSISGSKTASIVSNIGSIAEGKADKTNLSKVLTKVINF